MTVNVNQSSSLVNQDGGGPQLKDIRSADVRGPKQPHKSVDIYTFLRKNTVRVQKKSGTSDRPSVLESSIGTADQACASPVLKKLATNIGRKVEEPASANSLPQPPALNRATTKNAQSPLFGADAIREQSKSSSSFVSVASSLSINDSHSCHSV